MNRFGVALFFVLWGLCGGAGATFTTPDETVPVERLVENLTRFVEEHPEDAGAVYTLGRVYSFAYAQGRGPFNVYKRFGPYWEPALGWSMLPRIDASARGALTGKRLEDLLQAIRHMRRAVELNSENGLYWLGLGFVYREASRHADDMRWEFTGSEFDETAAGKAGDKRFWEDLALAAYRKARSFETDPYPVEGVAVDAAHGIMGILKGRAELTDEEKKEFRRVKRITSYASSVPPPITPVVFSVENLPLEELAPGGRVSFDVDGSGRGRRWGGVRPGTAFLVWDPRGTGHITSGKQLFGNVTWWMFWRNGYEPLAALDDNGDGWLRGRELTGMAVWRDMNGNGVSEGGEVTPALAFGVRAIHTRPGVRTGGTLWTGQGVKMSDGSILATYDWVSAPERSAK